MELLIRFRQDEVEVRVFQRPQFGRRVGQCQGLVRLARGDESQQQGMFCRQVFRFEFNR